MKKRIFSFFMASIMALSMATAVFAGDPEPTPVTGSTGEGTVTGGGDTEYVDTNIFSVLLPTSAAWNFTLDPQGLTGLLADENPAKSEAGVIVPGEYVPKVVNLSSVPITLTVSLQIAGDVNAVSNEADVEAAPTTDNKQHNILLNVIPAADSVDLTTTEFPGGADSDGEFPLSKDEQLMKFVLEEATYDFELNGDTGKFEYKKDAADEGNGTMLQLGGKVNTQANWLDFTGDAATKNVTLSAVFKYAAATEEEKDADNQFDADIYGLLKPGIEVADPLSGEELAIALREATSDLTDAIAAFGVAMGSLDTGDDNDADDIWAALGELKDVIDAAETLLDGDLDYGDFDEEAYEAIVDALGAKISEAKDEYDDIAGQMDPLKADKTAVEDAIDALGIAMGTFDGAIIAGVQTTDIDDLQAAITAADGKLTTANEVVDADAELEGLIDDLVAKIADANTLLLANCILVTDGTTDKVTEFANPSVAQTLVVYGLPSDVTITGVKTGVLALTKGQQYTYTSGNKFAFTAAKAWAQPVNIDAPNNFITITFKYSGDATAKTAIIPGISQLVPAP